MTLSIWTGSTCRHRCGESVKCGVFVVVPHPRRFDYTVRYVTMIKIFMQMGLLTEATVSV